MLLLGYKISLRLFTFVWESLHPLHFMYDMDDYNLHHAFETYLPFHHSQSTWRSSSRKGGLDKPIHGKLFKTAKQWILTAKQPSLTSLIPHLFFQRNSAPCPHRQSPLRWLRDCSSATKKCRFDTLNGAWDSNKWPKING